MTRKITIIGAGAVGSTIAYSLSDEDLASQIVMIDINKQKAEGEVMDIIQGTSFRDPINIISGDYEDAVDSDIVIITSGVARKPGQTRLDLAQTNVNIMKDIAPQIAAVAPNAIYIIVANPVDIMTYAFIKLSGLPQKQVIGSGTLLDTARLKCGLAQHFGIAQNNIHAYVFGEHGDTSFVPWSRAHIASATIEEFTDLLRARGQDVKDLDRNAILEYVRTSGSQIIKNKGATFYAVSASVIKLCQLILAGSDSTAMVSTMLYGHYGIDDVCMSILTIIGPNGIRGHLPVRLTEEEMYKLQKSADALKAIISQLTF
ncbi:MAG: L-lactate dehydrogenase [Lachnospiraceae bacterium]|nr:L-lactate dehydrogenase [Candidatus Equihabitans merdae]